MKKSSTDPFVVGAVMFIAGVSAWFGGDHFTEVLTALARTSIMLLGLISSVLGFFVMGAALLPTAQPPDDEFDGDRGGFG